MDHAPPLIPAMGWVWSGFPGLYRLKNKKSQAILFFKRVFTVIKEKCHERIGHFILETVLAYRCTALWT
jgi:hypothetical protein